MKQISNLIFPAIYYRKSTRSYSDVLVSKAVLDSLQVFINGLVPLFPSEKAAFEIQDHKGATMKIAAYAEDSPASIMNMAFMLQQVDLYLSSIGIGSLWNATIRATKSNYQGLKYRISIVFGIASESPKRTDESQFNRKALSEISNNQELLFVKAVQLAPSARNRQSWYLMCKEKTIDIYFKKENLFDKALLKNLSWVDIGIAICHLAVYLLHDGLNPAAAIKTTIQNKTGYNYCISLDY